MYKNLLFIVLLGIMLVLISGCTHTQNATNGTFGEKTISLNNISIINETAANRDYNGANYYIISGYLKNNNKYDAYNLKMKATTFDANNKVVEVRDTPYLNPKVIPAQGEAFFSYNFANNDSRIVRYELQLISVTVEP